MKGHVDAGTLAEFREGLLRRRRAARVAAHVAGCARCAETDARLAGVTTLLATSPVPPVPAGLTARIEAALAAEAASRAAQASHAAAGEAARAGHPTPDGPADGAASRRAGHATPVPGWFTGGRRAGPADTSPSDPSHPGQSRAGRSRLALRAAAVTAAVAVVAGGGYGVAQLISGGSPAASGAGSAGIPAAGRHAAAAPVPARKNLGMSGSATRSGLPLVRSGTDYRPGQLGPQASAVLARFGQRRIPASAGTASRRPGAFSAFTDLPACVRRVSGGRSPRLVDLASYRGAPAAVIMVRVTSGRVAVWVVGAGCSARATDLLAHTTVAGGG